MGNNGSKKKIAKTVHVRRHHGDIVSNAATRLAQAHVFVTSDVCKKDLYGGEQPVWEKRVQEPCYYNYEDDVPIYIDPGGINEAKVFFTMETVLNEGFDRRLLPPIPTFPQLESPYSEDRYSQINDGLIDAASINNESTKDATFINLSNLAVVTELTEAQNQQTKPCSAQEIANEVYDDDCCMYEDPDSEGSAVPSAPIISSGAQAQKLNQQKSKQDSPKMISDNVSEYSVAEDLSYRQSAVPLVPMKSKEELTQKLSSHETKPCSAQEIANEVYDDDCCMYEDPDSEGSAVPSAPIISSGAQAQKLNQQKAKQDSPKMISDNVSEYSVTEDLSYRQSAVPLVPMKSKEELTQKPSLHEAEPYSPQEVSDKIPDCISHHEETLFKQSVVPAAEAQIQMPSLHYTIPCKTDTVSRKVSERTIVQKFSPLKHKVASKALLKPLEAHIQKPSVHEMKISSNRAISNEVYDCKDYEEMVEIFKPLIIKNLSVCEILPYLPFIRDNDEIMDVAYRRSSSEAVIILLRELKYCKEVGKWHKFMEALQHCGYKYIVDNINGYKFINYEYQTEYLKSLTPKLCKMLNARELLPRLCAEDIISPNDREEIEKKDDNHGNFAAAFMLLTRIPKKLPDWYTKFIEVLRDGGFSHIADDLDIPDLTRSERIKVKSSSKPESMQLSTDGTAPLLPSIDQDRELNDFKVENAIITNSGPPLPPRRCYRPQLPKPPQWRAMLKFQANSNYSKSDVHDAEVCMNKGKQSNNETGTVDVKGYVLCDEMSPLEDNNCQPEEIYDEPKEPSGNNTSGKIETERDKEENPNDTFHIVKQQVCNLQDERNNLDEEIIHLQAKSDLQKDVNQRRRRKRELLRSIAINEKEATALDAPVSCPITDEYSEDDCPESARIFWMNRGNMYSSKAKTTLHFTNDLPMDNLLFNNEPIKIYDPKSVNGKTWSYKDSAIYCEY